MKAVALCCSDLHLSHEPPPARSGEPDWYAAMERSLSFLREMAEEYHVPILYAGDIFDRWNAPVGLVNWAIKHLPHGIAIPGQHDLPHHELAAIEKSAYWNLVMANVLTHLDGPLAFPHMVIHGFPWSREFGDNAERDSNDKRIHIALRHTFVWNSDSERHAGATETQRIQHQRTKGWDKIVYGDNHMHFQTNSQHYNCGTFMRRRSNEKDYRPRIGLIMDNGAMVTKVIPPEREVFETTTGVHAAEMTLSAGDVDVSSFVKALNDTPPDQLDLEYAIRKAIEGLDKDDLRKRILKEAIEYGIDRRDIRPAKDGRRLSTRP